MKKSLITVFAAAAILLSAFFTGCADVNGLHNQAAAQVTFKFTNFPESIDGSYAIPGNFNSWDNTTALITMTKGSGTSSAISISDVNIQFTLVATGSWTRTWCPEVNGNGYNEGKYQNFYIDGLNLDAGTLTVTIDGNNGTPTAN